MAISYGNFILASDITNLFTYLNQIRNKHGLGNLTTPSRIAVGQMIYADDVQQLPSYMTTTSQQAPYIPDRTYTISGVVRGSLIYPGFATTLQSDLDSMNAICPHCSANYTSYRSDDSDDSSYKDNWGDRDTTIDNWST